MSRGKREVRAYIVAARAGAATAQVSRRNSRKLSKSWGSASGLVAQSAPLLSLGDTRDRSKKGADALSILPPSSCEV